MEKGFIGRFNESHFCRSIVYLICYVFLVQSCIWMMPLSAHGYHAPGHEKYQGILSDITEAFNNTLDLFLPAEAYAAPPMVVCVPWYPPDPLVPHETWPGKSTILKGVAGDVDNNLSGGTYYWDFGDGTTSSPASISNPDNLSVTHTYNVTPGTLIIARLYVNDAAGEASFDEYRILVKEKTLDVEVNKAIDDGLWWLYTQKESLSSSRFRWNNSRYGNHYANTTASAVQAFEINGHIETGNPDEDPYVSVVRGGIDYLLTILRTYNMSLQAGEDPDSNHNGIGLSVNSNRPIYETGAVMDTFVASGTPDALARAGGANVIGRRYQDIVQDMVDMYAWGQDDSGSDMGGWRYSWNSDADNSAAQWGAIGMIAAERHFGCIVPQWVKDRNNSWLNNSYNSAGYFGYTGRSPNRALSTGPCGMVQLSFAGKDISDPRWVACERYVANNWGSFLNPSRDCRYYSYYTFAKAMRLALPQEVTHLAATGLDWYGDEIHGLARHLVNTQSTNGSWPYDGWPYVGERTAAGWNIIILTRTLFERPPVAIINAHPNPGAIGQVINLDASDSYHVDPSKVITGYLWDFDASDGVDFDNPDATGIQTVTDFGALGDFIVSLKVIDNSVPARFDISTLTIRITIPPHAPTAVVGGPYISTVGEEVHVDGSGSYDVDEPEGDSITAWDWEADFIAPYDFAEAHGEKAVLSPYITPGSYDIALRITDNTETIFPASGQPNLTNAAYGGVAIYRVGVTDLQARPKATKCQLTWTHIGIDSYEVLRSEKGPNEGYELIGTTGSTYSTYIDYNVELKKDYWYRIRTAQNGEVSLSGPVHVNSIGRLRNYPPVITSEPVTDAREAMPYQYDVEASDPEGAALAYLLDQAPDGMSIDASTGLITWIPDRQHIGLNDVTVRVMDTPGASATQFFQVLVESRPNTAPVADTGGPYSGLTNEVISFDGSGSSDPEGDPITDYHWVFGDGTETHGMQVTHTYTASNKYTVTIYVTDDRGATGSAETTCQIEAPNLPPIADAGGPYSGHVWTIITFNGSGSSDPDGDALNYTWNFGDSTPPETGISVSHIYPLEGTYTVTLNVDDTRGGLDTDSVNVIIGPPNEAPDAEFTGSTFGNVGDEFTFDASSSGDPDGDIISYEWDFNDGSTTTGAVVTHVFDTPGHYTISLSVTDDDNAEDTATLEVHINAPPEITFAPETTALEDNLYTYDAEANDPDGDTLTYSLTEAPSGMSINGATGLIRWMPTQAQVGNNPVTVLVNDGNGRTATQSFTVTVQNVNDAPQVTSTPVSSATEDTPYVYDVEAADEDGDVLIYSLTVAPTGMTIDSATGLIQWTPTQARIGDNNVTVTVADGNGGEDNQSFTITVGNLNDPPSIISTPPLTVLEDSVYTYDMEATDEDGDALTFSLSLAPSGMTIASDAGLIQWQPDQADVGTHDVTITVSDGHGGTDTQSYTLTVENVNDPPEITSVPLTGAVKDFLYTYDVEATDQDGDALIFILDISPTGMTIDSSTGLIQWTPGETQTGPHTIEILVTDGQGGSVTQSYTLTVSATNTAPQITSAPVTTATQGQPYSYDVEASDPDGDPITFSLDTAPSGMTIGPDTGLIQWTPNDTQTGENQVIVAASDNKGAATTQIYTIDVQNINDPPEITSTPVILTGVTVLYTYDVEALDIDGDTVIYSLDVSPSAMTIDSDTGLIQWTPGDPDLGDHTVRVRVRDPFGAFDIQEYTLTVQQIIDNTPPRVSNIIIDPLILDPGETATITIDAIDNQAIGSYELQVDGVDIPLVGNTATYTATIIGVHEIQATVCDTSGNCDSLIASFGVRDPGDTTPPFVSITAPATDSELTAPTDLTGTASDENIVSYTLEYSEKDKNNFVVFYQDNTEVVNDILGTLDPSLLINGLYDIRLSAVDVNGLTDVAMVTYRITGDLKVGNFTVTFKDLEIPVAGIPITIYRTYDSRTRQGKGDFGYGWNLDIRTTKVEENREMGEGWYSQSSGGLIPTYYLLPDGEHYVSITLPDGQTLEFDCKFIPESQFLIPITWVTSAVYTPRPGTYGSLVALDDSPMYFNGSQVVNDYFEVYDPDRYRLTTIDGTVYIIDETEGLQKVTDNNDNSLDITYGGIIHSTGKSVTFTRDAQGRITEITDPMGNIITYDYDFRGDLVAFTDQEGNTSNYTYNNNHGLVDIFDPTGNKPMRNEYDYDGRLIAHIDAEGNRIEYTHDPDSRQEIISDRLGNITVFEYDDDGNVTKKTDALGNVTTYAYDVRGNTLSETDPLGNTTTYTYDAKDNMLTKTDPLGNTTSYTYNAKGRPLTITDPMGNITTNTYDAKGNHLSIADPIGNVLTNTYDGGGNLSSGTDPLGNVTGYSYDVSGNMTSQTDPLGNITTFTYDNNGNELTKTFTRTTSSGTETISVQSEYDSMNRLIKNTDPYGNSTITEYNAVGKRSATIDQNGNRTDYEYDSMGNIKKITYPDGTVETSTYDAEGRKTSSTDRAGRTTQYIYDALGRIIKTIYHDGSSTTSTYDAAGRTTTQTDTRGNTTSYTYDAAGHRTSIIDPYGNVTNYTYDANGNQIAMTDANGNIYVYEYDKNNRLIKTIFPDGTFTTTTYNEIGWKTSETDQAGNTTNFAYDAKGQLISVTDALGNVTTYEYDELGNKISQTDANGNTIMWEYDKLGRVTKKSMPLGMVEITEYDAAGNVISKTDFKGNTTTYTYDDNNRITQKIYPDSSSVSYIYNSTGQKISDLDSRGLTTYEYDLLNRLIKRTDPDGTTISYTYDAAGNRTSVTTPSGTTMYSYDSLNRLETVIDPDFGVTTYSYDKLGNRINVKYPNGTKALYTYDTLNRLIRLENKRHDDSILSSYNYTLGPTGNRIKVQEHTGRTVDYIYDALYRLIQENITDPVLGDRIISYSYDPVGNRLTKFDSVDGTISYTYDNNDRLLSENGTTYTYDNNGNTITKTEGSDITTYSYDYENRPVEVHTPTSLISYIYDSDGIKVNSTVNGAVTSYLVDKNRAYAQVLEETDAGSSLIASYVQGDDLISMKRGSFQFFYHYDGNGNTRELTDFSETITDTYIYDAFGVILNRTGVTENNYLFTGEQYDVNIGFYYLRARYYNQATGRFQTSDPMEPFPGSIYDPPSLHLYVYTKNNPVNYIDPSGNFGICGVMISIAVISIINLIAITWPGSFIGRAYKAIGKLLPDGIILGAAGSVHLLRRIPKFSGRLPLGYGGQAGIEWVLNVGSSEEGFFFYAGLGASISASWNVVRYVAFVYRLHNLLGHYAGPSNAFGIGERIQVGFFFGTGSPSGNYWGLVYSRQIIGSSGFSISGVRNWARPLSVRSYSTMWPMVGYATALGAIIGGYLGRNAASAVVGATMGYIWPFTKWLEGPELRSRQAWR